MNTVSWTSTESTSLLGRALAFLRNGDKGCIPSIPEVKVRRNEPRSVSLCHKKAELVVLNGTAWITQSGDEQDYVLGPGETFRATTAGRIVAQGLPECTLRIRPIDRPLAGRR